MASDGRKVSGEFGAEGIGGGEAIAKQLDDMAAGIKTEITSERGLEARLKYLTNSGTGYDAMNRAGIEVTPRTLLAWLSGDRDPNKQNLAKIERAYQDLRRQNMARSMKRRLSNNGQGTRIEVHPVNQAKVAPNQRRDLNVRNVNVRPSQWDQLVDAWARGDVDQMDDIWEGIAEDAIGSDWAAYSSVSAIGFSA